jgi:hypothetical protein
MSRQSADTRQVAVCDLHPARTAEGWRGAGGRYEPVVRRKELQELLLCGIRKIEYPHRFCSPVPQEAESFYSVRVRGVALHGLFGLAVRDGETERHRFDRSNTSAR